MIVAKKDSARRFRGGCMAHTALEIEKKREPGRFYEVEKVDRGHWIVIVMDGDGNLIGYL